MMKIELLLRPSPPLCQSPQYCCAWLIANHLFHRSLLLLLRSLLSPSEEEPLCLTSAWYNAHIYASSLILYRLHVELKESKVGMFNVSFAWFYL